MRRTRARGLLIGGVVLALVGLGFVLGRTMVRRQTATRSEGQELAPDVSQRIRNFRRVKVKDGRKVWELTATEAQYFVDQGHVLVTGPEVSFFGRDGRDVGIRGRAGKVYLDGNSIERIELGGGIEVRIGDYLVRMPEAVYVQAQDAIVSAGPVELASPEIELDGRGLLVELGRQRVQLLHGVRTTLRGKATAERGVATEGGPVAAAAVPTALLSAAGTGEAAVATGH